MDSHVSVAIDGPVASGKTAVGRLLAERMHCRFLDTGAMYRAVTLSVLDADIDPEDENAVASLLTGLDLEVEWKGREAGFKVNGEDVTSRLRDAHVGPAVSLVSRVPAVRAALVEKQQALAREGPIVMAGRDIGSVVLKHATLKLYLDASLAVRARRRFEELRGTARCAAYSNVVEELSLRDKIDSERRHSPLRPADGAVRMDTGTRGVGELVTEIERLLADR